MPPRLPRFIVPTPAAPAPPALLPALHFTQRPCGDFAEWWFALKCSGANCRRSVGYPVRLLRERRYCRDDSNVLLVARRFRCEVCGGKPAGVGLCERIDRLPGSSHGGGSDSEVFDFTPLLGGELDAAYD